ncbi:MAG: tRNA-(ms[2]io[6]A)-hydroxylase [Pseudomonadota bacterium]
MNDVETLSEPIDETRPTYASDVPQPIREFLDMPTPGAWLLWAETHLEALLVDHANCEKKAASSAMAMLFRYPEEDALVYRMSRLAREELRHFEQVSAIMKARGVAWRTVPASRYAGWLRRDAATEEPRRLSDHLIIGAFIEARSCERFAALLPQLDDELATFYGGLLASEARHFEQYLALAKAADAGDFDERVARVRALDAAAISTPDSAFSFHSGPPPTGATA